MDGLLKEVSQPSVSPVSPTTPASPPVIYEGMPIEFIDYFEIDIKRSDDRTRRQVSEIYELSKDGCNDMGDILTKIRSIENRLGAPTFGETRYGKVWTYLRLSGRISDLEKQRKAMETQHGTR